MKNEDAILEEADKLAEQLYRRGVDLSEAEKTGDYYIRKGYSEKAMDRYLDLMATRPPPRSQRSQRYFQAIQTIWTNWRTTLSGADKARAWQWGVRGAKALRNATTSVGRYRG